MRREKTENKTVRKGSVECPEFLAQYIEVVNLLPSGLVLLTPEELNPDVPKTLSGKNLHRLNSRQRGNALRAVNLWIEDIEDYYQELPNRVRKFLFDGIPKKPKTLQQAKKIAHLFFTTQYETITEEIYSNYDDGEIILLFSFLNTILDRRVKELRCFATFLESLVRLNEGKVVPRVTRLINQLSFNLEFPLGMNISPTGFLQIADDNILQMLIREKVDVSRIKRCPVCSNIFWASRSNRKACSEKCVATNRQRNYRQRDKKAESEKKRENRQYQKIRGAGKRRR